MLKPGYVVTNYSNDTVSKMRSAEYLANSLSAGSKNLLRQYRNNLSISRGLNSPLFDKDVIDLALRYALNPTDFKKQIVYLNSLEDSDGFRFSRNLKIYSKSEPAIARFAEPDHTSFRWNRNYQQAIEWLKSYFRNLRLKPLSFTTDDDVRDALPKVNTHSGYTYILSGMKEKGSNMEGVLNRLNIALTNASENGTLGIPMMVAFRTQASGEYDDDGVQTGKCKHKLRVVLMVDLLQIVLELMFSNPLQKYLSKFKYYAGGKDGKKISSFISHQRAHNRKFLSIDYSSYDQTISSWLIEDAFSVLKEAFVMNEYQEWLWNIVVHDFIHKQFILNEGILDVHKGVPSGSMFTQIIDSIVNLLVVKTYFIRSGAQCEMMVMGDDNIIFTDNLKIHINDLSSYIIKNFGLIIDNDDKNSEGYTSEDPKFLSRFWTNYGEWRHPHQLISRLAFPERKRLYSDEVTPAHVLLAFCLTYDAGMRKLINVVQFREDYPISEKNLFDNVDSRYLPGSLAYIREYVRSVA